MSSDSIFWGLALPWTIQISIFVLPILGVYLIYLGYFKPKKNNEPIKKENLFWGIIMIAVIAFVLFAPKSR